MNIDAREKIGHMTRDEMESFRAGALPWQETVLCAEHLDLCDICKRSYDQVTQSLRPFRPLVFNFSPAAHVKEFHLGECETLAPYVDAELDEELGEMVELHLQSCRRCREDLRFFKEYRLKEDMLERELEGWRGSRSFWDHERNRLTRIGALASRPIYAALLLLFCLGIVMAVVLLRHSSGGTQVQMLDAPPSSAPTPTGQVAPPTQAGDIVRQGGGSQHTPAEKIEVGDKGPLLVALNDGGRRYGLDRHGRLVGLDSLAPGLRGEIAAALKKGHVRTHTPDEVAHVAVNKRGIADEAGVTLLAPNGVVIAQDRPTLRWELLPGATGYVVMIVDSAFRPVVRSAELRTTEWRVPVQLNRGEIYRWQVTALRGREEFEDGGEAVGKFKVISADAERELERAKRSYPLHLVLGLLYARGGMVDDAAREFEALVKENPRSRLARELLRSVRSRK